MKNKPITEQERQKIIDLLHEHGGNRTKVANIAKRDRRVVCKIGDKAGIPSAHSARTKNARAARSAFAEERRLELIGKGFDKADSLLDTPMGPDGFQKWTVALAVLVDKARLETGEATSRTDTKAEHAEREQRFDRLYDALDSARRTGADEHSGTGHRGESVDTNGS